MKNSSDFKEKTEIYLSHKPKELGNFNLVSKQQRATRKNHNLVPDQMMFEAQATTSTNLRLNSKFQKISQFPEDTHFMDRLLSARSLQLLLFWWLQNIHYALINNYLKPKYISNENCVCWKLMDFSLLNKLKLMKHKLSKWINGLHNFNITITELIKIVNNFNIYNYSHKITMHLYFIYLYR